MRSSEQITVGALAIKEVTRNGDFFDSAVSKADALLTAERGLYPRSAMIDK